MGRCAGMDEQRWGRRAGMECERDARCSIRRHSQRAILFSFQKRLFFKTLILLLLTDLQCPTQPHRSPKQPSSASTLISNPSNPFPAPLVPSILSLHGRPHHRPRPRALQHPHPRQRRPALRLARGGSIREPPNAQGTRSAGFA